MTQVKCPLCNGSGEIEKKEDRKATMKDKIETAKQLRAHGHSIRQIMTRMGYRSPRSVAWLLEK